LKNCPPNYNAVLDPLQTPQRLCVPTRDRFGVVPVIYESSQNLKVLTNRTQAEISYKFGENLNEYNSTWMIMDQAKNSLVEDPSLFIDKSATSILLNATLLGLMGKGPHYVYHFVNSSIFLTSNFFNLTVNNPPNGGVFEFSPPNGSTILTEFIVNVSGWNDTEASDGLSFSIEYEDTTSNPSTLVMLRDAIVLKSDQPQFIEKLRFPFLGQSPINLTIHLNIADIYGASSNSSLILTLFPPMNISTNLRTENSILSNISSIQDWSVSASLTFMIQRVFFCRVPLCSHQVCEL
jgi:hypothetical protein